MNNAELQPFLYAIAAERTETSLLIAADWCEEKGRVAEVIFLRSGRVEPYAGDELAAARPCFRVKIHGVQFDRTFARRLDAWSWAAGIMVRVFGACPRCGLMGEKCGEVMCHMDEYLQATDGLRWAVMRGLGIPARLIGEQLFGPTPPANH